MNEPSLCKRCDIEYLIRAGMEDTTGLCDPCAQHEVATLKAENESLKIQLNDAHKRNAEMNNELGACKGSRRKDLHDYTVKTERLVKAETGMLENYIVLKQISLAMARSDAPDWIGARMTPGDDIHVQAVRKALSEHQNEKGTK